MSSRPGRRELTQMRHREADVRVVAFPAVIRRDERDGRLIAVFSLTRDVADRLVHQDRDVARLDRPGRPGRSRCAGPGEPWSRACRSCSPSTCTQPFSIHSSASRREHRPSSDISLDRRKVPGASSWSRRCAARARRGCFRTRGSCCRRCAARCLVGACRARRARRSGRRKRRCRCCEACVRQRAIARTPRSVRSGRSARAGRSPNPVRGARVAAVIARCALRTIAVGTLDGCGERALAAFVRSRTLVAPAVAPACRTPARAFVTRCAVERAARLGACAVGAKAGALGCAAPTRLVAVRCRAGRSPRGPVLKRPPVRGAPGRRASSAPRGPRGRASGRAARAFIARKACWPLTTVAFPARGAPPFAFSAARRATLQPLANVRGARSANPSRRGGRSVTFSPRTRRGARVITIAFGDAASPADSLRGVARAQHVRLRSGAAHR